MCHTCHVLYICSTYWWYVLEPWWSPLDSYLKGLRFESQHQHEKNLKGTLFFKIKLELPIGQTIFLFYLPVFDCPLVGTTWRMIQPILVFAASFLEFFYLPLLTRCVIVSFLTLLKELTTSRTIMCILIPSLPFSSIAFLPLSFSTPSPRFLPP